MPIFAYFVTNYYGIFNIYYVSFLCFVPEVLRLKATLSAPAKRGPRAETDLNRHAWTGNRRIHVHLCDKATIAPRACKVLAVGLRFPVLRPGWVTMHIGKNLQFRPSSAEAPPRRRQNTGSLFRSPHGTAKQLSVRCVAGQSRNWSDRNT